MEREQVVPQVATLPKIPKKTENYEEEENQVAKPKGELFDVDDVSTLTSTSSLHVFMSLRHSLLVFGASQKKWETEIWKIVHHGNGIFYGVIRVDP